MMMTPIEGYRGKWRVIVFSSVLLGVVATTGWAQITNLSNGGSVNFSALVGTNGVSVLIGDKLFSNFGFSYVDTEGNIGNGLTASNLVLSSLFNQEGFGVSIQLPLVATGITIKDVTLEFAETVWDSSDEISDVHLDFAGTVSGNGIAIVSESIFTNGFGDGLLASLSLTETASGFDPLGGEATAIYTEAQSKIWVEKDILVSGNPTAIPDNNPAKDYAAITIINQTFSQIPEPSTMVLSLAGMVALLFVRRRQ